MVNMGEEQMDILSILSLFHRISVFQNIKLEKKTVTNNFKFNA